jgi:hypothetical protein
MCFVCGGLGQVFLQSGKHDLDNVHGSWPLANREMA